MRHHPGTNPLPFEASVIDKTEDSLILSKSFCYPRGGGQPGDTGIFINDEKNADSLRPSEVNSSATQSTRFPASR